MKQCFTYTVSATDRELKARDNLFVNEVLPPINTSNQMPTLGINQFFPGKVEKILKDSLDSFSSPSPLVEIQIMGGKICLMCKGKTLLGVVNKLFVFNLYTSSKFSRP